MSSKSKKAYDGPLPKVSVMSTTYNQEQYIREALESFVSQKTDFDFEVVIADDASTDKTPAIIEEYAHQYPNIFRPILRQKNIGAWENYLSVLRACRGEYIAICEGDDYWTDNRKLQKQADFLDAHPDYALCFHPVNVFFEGDIAPSYIFPKKRSGFTTGELLRENFIQTNSVMYRRKQYGDMPKDIVPGDWYVHLYHAQFGKIGFQKEVMSAYRRHPGGLWWNSYADIEKIWLKHGLTHLALYEAIMKLFGSRPEYRKIINRHINNLLNALVEADTGADHKLVERAANRFPDAVATFIAHQQQEFKKREKLLESLDSEINVLQQRLHAQDRLIEQKEHELAMIKSSKAWRARNKIAKITGKDEIT